jgi:hypothetical protein
VQTLLRNRGAAPLQAVLTAGTAFQRSAVPSGGSHAIVHDLSATGGRYDLSVAAPGFERRLAGRFTLDAGRDGVA